MLRSFHAPSSLPASASAPLIKVMYTQGLGTHLLPPPEDGRVPHEPRPGQRLYLPTDAGRGGLAVGREQLRGATGKVLALGDEVPADEAEDALGQQVRADVEVAGVAGAEGEGVVREAVGGDVGVGGAQQGALGRAEGPLGWKMVVGVVGTGMGAGAVGTRVVRA